MSTGIDPTALPPAPEPAAPTPSWDNWGQVGFDPAGDNPYEIHQHHKWVTALQSEKDHEPTLEQALRDWQYLQEGETLNDLTSALEAVRANRADPFAAMRPAEPTGAPEPNFDMSEPGVDPEILRQVWKQDQQEAIRAMREEMETEQRSREITGSLQSQLNTVALANKFDPTDRSELWQRVQNKINSGQVHPEQLDTLVADTHKEHEDYINALIARRVAAAGEGGTVSLVPAPSEGGAQPTTTPPPTSFKSIASATIQRIRDAEGAS